MTPNIKFQADRIFVRNDLFEQIIKSCKATNVEFTMLKEKLGICPYEENYYEEEIIKIQDDIEETYEKSTKELTKELIEELIEESDKESDKESDEELIEIISPKNDESTADWYDKNKFNKILTSIDSYNFNHKNKIGKSKFKDTNNFVNNNKNNTISEAYAKQKLNALNEIKKAEIKGKRLISGQKKLLNLFDELIGVIFDDNVRMNKDDNDVSVNEDDKISVNKDDNDVSMNEDENESESESENENEKENENGDEQYYKIKQLNNYFETTDETKSFEEQMEILKKRDFLDEYWHEGYYHDNKELNLKIFKAKAAYLDVDEYLFKKIFGQTFAALANKLINTTSKEENQIIINDIKKNKDKIYEQDDFNNFVIHPGYKRGDLLDAVKILPEYNEVIQLERD